MRSLRRALVGQLRTEYGDQVAEGDEARLLINMAMRLTVPIACGYSRAEAQERMNLTPGEARELMGLVERAVERLET